MAFSNRSQYPQTWFGRNKIWILSLSGLAVIVIIIVCATSFSSTEPGTTTTSIPIITSPSTSSTTTPSATTPKKQFNVTAPKGNGHKYEYVGGYLNDSIEYFPSCP